jgi:hypothetical protein
VQERGIVQQGRFDPVQLRENVAACEPAHVAGLSVFSRTRDRETRVFRAGALPPR